MYAICREILGVIREYYGDLVFLILAVISYIYLFVKDRDLRRRWLYPIALIMFCVINPVLYKYIFQNIIYWRLFWMFPDAIVIALASTRLIRDSRKIWKKVVVALLLVVAVISAGNLAYKQDSFCLTENWYKLPDEVIKTCDIILRQDDEARCIMPSSLYNYVRQYSGDILQLYGRNANGFITDITGVDKKIAVYMNREFPPYDDILSYARFHNYNYIVTDVEKAISVETLEEYGYAQIGTTGVYNIYSVLSESQDSEWLITQYGTDTKWYSTMYTVENEEDKLIIIDGGESSNMDALMNVIKAHNGHVDAWILTTYRKDHIEAFLDIASDYTVTIDRVYTSDMDFDSLRSSTKIKSISEFYLRCEEVLGESENVNYLRTGDTFQISDLEFKVYNAWSPACEDIENIVNDSSLVFSLSGEKNSMLFCSDITERQENSMVKSMKDKTFEYIQLSNHGVGLSGQFYSGLQARAVFLDTCVNKIKKEEERSGVTDLTNMLTQSGIRVYSFTSRPNMVLIR